MITSEEYPENAYQEQMAGGQMPTGHAHPLDERDESRFSSRPRRHAPHPAATSYAAAECCLNFCSSAGFGAKPITESTNFPSLKNRIVGIDRTLYFIAVF